MDRLERNDFLTAAGRISPISDKTAGAIALLAKSIVFAAEILAKAISEPHGKD